jgi:hypothetical protein
LAKTIREDLSADERSLAVRHYIDPGFVNHRLIETIIGEKGIEAVNRTIASLPDLPDWQRRQRINHIYTRVALTFCEALQIPSLGEVLAMGKGRMFCSTERMAPSEDVYTAQRLSVSVQLVGEIDHEVRLAFGTEHIFSDTLKAELREGAELSVIAAMPRLDGEVLTFQPLVIGSPWLEIDDPKWTEKIVWWGHEFYEQFIEDFDEFVLCEGTATPTIAEAKAMKGISESAFKTCLAEILGEETTNDWGGEVSDHYSAHLHLRGKRVSGAFLLKGPSRFAPMTLNHLGKNNDQIYRLAKEPADVLFVQHCHDIGPEVRETLRHFAVQPNRPRRYCLIDGRDSLRLLRAYGKVEEALTLSKKGKSQSGRQSRKASAQEARKRNDR